MRLPMAYHVDYVRKINRIRIILGILLGLASLLILKDNTFLVGPGTVLLTPAYCFGTLLMMMSIYFLSLGLTKKSPHYIFWEWPATRTPIASFKKTLREIWADLNTEI